MKAWLEGDAIDLLTLTQLFCESDVRVLHDADEDAYYLTAPEIDNPPDGTSFYDAAGRIMQLVNGMGCVGSANFRPVRLNGKYGTPDGGHHAVVAAVNLEVRIGLHASGVVNGPDGQPMPDPPSPWPARFALADTNELVARALRFMSFEPLGWVELRKVHEIICRDIEPKKLDRLGWTTKARDRAFTGSADRYDVSGDAARHAVDRHAEPPQHTMTFDEGRDYIRALVTQWLDSMT